MSQAKNKYLNLSVYLIVFAVMVGLLVVIINALTGRSEYISSDNIEKSVGSLSCSADDSSESFFDISKASHTVQDIKIIFSEDKIDSIMYTLEADYNNHETARVTESELHAYYDEYMSEHGLDTAMISNNFSLSDTKIRVKLYTERKNLNTTTDKLFMLDPSINYSSETLQKHYKSKGFICNYKD